MRASRIEAWALAVYDQIRSGGRSEDARVEVKRDWIPANRAARRLAGHANAARGDDILWLIGVDEASGEVQGLSRDDLANWLPQVQSEYVGPSPCCTDVVVYTNEGQFLALLFTTDQAPYVVKNRSPDGARAAPATLEVPWREGTAVRTATHADLLRLLVPIVALPEIELVKGALSLVGVYIPSVGGYRVPETGMRCEWRADLTLFVTPRAREPLIFPIHRCSLTVGESACIGSARFRLLETHDSAGMRMLVPADDLVVDRPRRLVIRAAHECHSYTTPASTATMELVLRPAGLDRAIRRSWALERLETEGEAPFTFRAVETAL